MIEMMERVCFYTFFGTQPYFLETVGYSAAEAGAINNIMGMFCYVTPILGGFISETYLGRFSTIVSFSVIYLLGLLCATLASYPTLFLRELYSVGVLGMIAVGTGGIKSCVCNFGADQFDVSSPREMRDQEKWFYFFYIAINLGALVAYGYLTTLATNGISPIIPQQYGYFSAYLVAGTCMLIGLLLFLTPSSKYRKVQPEGSNLLALCKYILAARSSKKGRIILIGWLLTALFIVFSTIQAFVNERILSYITFGLGMLALGILIPGYVSTRFMEYLKERPGLARDDARDVLRIIPTLFSASIGFNLLYNSMNYYNIQACQFNLIVGSQQISGSFFNIGDYIAIILFTSIWENYLYPCVGRLKGSSPTRNQKITGGFCFGFLSCASAAILEVFRRKAGMLTDKPFSNCAPPGTYMSDISGFWMFIPFFLTGIGEIMVNPVLFYFVFDQCPPSCGHLAHAVFLLTMALSNGLTSTMGMIMAPYINDDLDTGNLEMFYIFTIALAFFCLTVYYYVGTCFEEKNYDLGSGVAYVSARSAGLSTRSISSVALERGGDRTSF